MCLNIRSPLPAASELRGKIQSPLFLFLSTIPVITTYRNRNTNSSKFQPENELLFTGFRCFCIHNVDSDWWIIDVPYSFDADWGHDVGIPVSSWNMVSERQTEMEDILQWTLQQYQSLLDHFNLKHRQRYFKCYCLSKCLIFKGFLNHYYILLYIYY